MNVCTNKGKHHKTKSTINQLAKQDNQRTEQFSRYTETSLTLAEDHMTSHHICIVTNIAMFL